MHRILVITNGDSDFLRLLQKNCAVTVRSFDDAVTREDDFDALCLLAGNEENLFNPPARLQILMDGMRAVKKPVFCEFIGPIGYIRTRGTASIVRQRMVYQSKRIAADGLTDGDLLDGQTNECIKYAPLTEAQQPVLTYQEYVCAHSNIEMSEEKHRDGTWALWWADESTLVSSIRMCNFRRARFMPSAKWQALLASIVCFLAGEKLDVQFDAPVCKHCAKAVETTDDVKPAVALGLNWIKDAEILKNGGKDGAYEGFTNQINARTGEHTKNKTIRADCTCEIGGALLFDSFLTGNSQSRRYADELFKFTFDCLQVKDGKHSGMLRWSEGGWDICYQDDVARAVLPMLLAQHFDENIPHLEEIQAALDYMLVATSEDGMRSPETNMRTATDEWVASMKPAGSVLPCAHFNAYYHAVLLLAYRVCKKTEYLVYAERGLSAIMEVYPDTRRETSETEELCRLVLPLAVLYEVTGKKEHYDWLCCVVNDLETYRHSTGGYAEWDTGYKAFCSRNHKGECALLANNGDPVADLLYSNNWLPLGYAYAYLVTGEKRFYELWKSVSSFLLLAQMHSEEKRLNGAWARAFELENQENCGVPYDIGWGPYCIESGWTVGEILMGLQFMQLVEKKNGAGMR